MIYLCINMFTHLFDNDKDRVYQDNVEVYPIHHQLAPSHGSVISVKIFGVSYLSLITPGEQIK